MTDMISRVQYPSGFLNFTAAVDVASFERLQRTIDSSEVKKHRTPVHHCQSLSNEFRVISEDSQFFPISVTNRKVVIKKAVLLKLEGVNNFQGRRASRASKSQINFITFTSNLSCAM